MIAHSSTSWFVAALLVAAPFVACADEGDSLLSDQATTIDRLIRITKTPHEMADSTAVLCRKPIEEPHKIHDGFITSAYCHVYVSKVAEPFMRSGGIEYPVGSLIVKSKFPKDHPNRVELYTVMRKMEAGYDADNGDWEYSVIDGRSRRVQARGRIDSCIECHAAYSTTGYVTRAYIVE